MNSTVRLPRKCGLCSVQKIGKTARENVPKRRQQNRGRPAWLNREIKAAIKTGRGNCGRRPKKIWSGGVQRGGQEGEEHDTDIKRNFEKRLANEKGGNNRPFYAYVKKKQKAGLRLVH
jgi:hypothetical protein